MLNYSGDKYFCKNANDNGFQITDLLQLSRQEQESRLSCLNQLRKFNVWKKTHASHVNSGFVLFFWLEGILLKRQVQDAILFYRLVKRHRIKIFNDYMQNLSDRTFVGGASR